MTHPERGTPLTRAIGCRPHCKVIESEVTAALQAEELQQFEEWVCKVLYVTNEQTPIRTDLNAHALARQERLIQKYCI